MAKKENILLSLGLDTSKFNESLKNLEKGLKSSGEKLKEINKALKFDPKNTELLRQKQETLNRAISESKEKIETFKRIQEELKAQGVDRNSEAFQKLSREISLTHSSLKGFQGQLDKMKPPASLEVVGQKLHQLGDKTKRLSQVATAGMVALAGTSYMASQYADEINTLSKVYGMSAEEIQKIKYASELVDVSLETVAGSQKKLVQNMEQARKGSQDLNEAFSRLGVQYQENGELLSKQAVWKKVITALGEVENETEREALAMQLLGRSANDLNPIILEGVEAFEKASEGVRVLSQEELDRANKLGDSIEKTKASLHSATVELGSAFAPEFEQLSNLATAGITKITGIANKLPSGVRSGIVVTGTAVAGLSKGLHVLGTMSQGVNAVGKALNGLSKTGQAISGVSKGVGILSKGLSLLKGASGLASVVKIGGAVASIGGAFSSLGGIVSGIVVAVKGVALAVGGFFAGITAPVWGIVAAVVAGVAVIGYTVWKNWDAIKTFGLNTWNSLKEGVGVFVNVSKAFFDDFWHKIKSVFSSVGDFGLSVWNALKTGVQSVCDFMVSAFKSASDFVFGIFKGIGDTVGGVLSSVGSFFGLGGAKPKQNKPKGIGANIPHLSVGTDFVKRSGIAMIHGGEAVVKAGTNERYEKLLSYLEKQKTGAEEKILHVSTYLDGAKIGKSIHKIIGHEQAGDYRREYA